MLTFSRGKFLPYIIKVALFADFLAIPLFSLYLNIQFRRLQNKGLIDHYRINLRRIKKFYYELNLHVVIGSQQAKKLLRDLIKEVGLNKDTFPSTIIQYYLTPKESSKEKPIEM